MNRLPPLKPHQLSGLGKIRQARREGRVPLLVVAPCCGGKSRVITELAMDETRRGGRTVIKVHRKMLLDQLVGNFAAAGITPGVISPDYTPEPLHKIQIVSAQTVYSRAVLRSTLDMPEAQLVITDEAHQQSGTRERAIIFGSFQNNTVQVGYANNGADVIGFTATPLMNGRIYKHIIELASYSELRACGMHQLIATVGPTEIDTQGLNLNRAMEYSEKKLEERVQIIFGDVYSHWQVLNPMQLPTILFAPSVPSSRWFANQFFQRGVPVAHLDGTHCLIPEGGELKEYKTTRELRQHILDLSKAGEIKCIMNRFVLREAVDMPWLYHGITATVFGSVTTALQVVGRLQRKWPAYTHKILQDHGGIFWRHGDPNEDREWKLGDTAKQYSLDRVKKIQSGEIPEGIRCPKCGTWRKEGEQCYGCNNKHKQSVRVVRQITGNLKRMTGRIYKTTKSSDDRAKIWTSALFAGGRANRTVSSAVKLYADQLAAKGLSIDWGVVSNKPPSPDNPDWHRSVRDVFPWTVRRRVKT